MSDELYEKATVMAEKLDITFDELCVMGVKRLAEEHLKENKENEKI